MILSDTVNQPKVLAIYSILGIVFGILHVLNAFTCAYLVKNPFYRHVSQVIYVLIYGITFFLVTYLYFDYDLKIYHVLICIISTILTSMALYLPIRKRNKTIDKKCNALRLRISQSKLVKKFKK